MAADFKRKIIIYFYQRFYFSYKLSDFPEKEKDSEYS